MKLDFVCIGAQKAGTTTLHDILSTHPDIYLPPTKEAQFFDVNERYQKGLQFYKSKFFPTYNQERLVGNINPNLQLENRSIDRIIECFGINIKIIFILRNPVKRAYSHYLMSKSRGYEDLTFVEAIEKEHLRLSNPMLYPNYISKELGHFEKNHLGYIYRSKYLRTIKHLLENFPRENIKFVLFEDFVRDKETVVQNILTFLNMPSSNSIGYEVTSNVASEPRSKFIRDFFYRPNTLRGIMKNIVSSNQKKWIKNKILLLNAKPLSQEQKKLSPKIYDKIFQAYFLDDMEDIQRLTNLNIIKWAHS